MELTRNNYEEYFLLYVDRELSETDRAVVEKFVEQNPDLRKELDDLQETVLTLPGEIVFDQKDTLYRQEEAKVVGFPWWRAMAAAVVLLFLGTATWLYVTTSSTHENAGALATNNNNLPEKNKPAPVGNHENKMGVDPAEKTSKDSAPLASINKASNKATAAPVVGKSNGYQKNRTGKHNDEIAVNSGSHPEKNPTSDLQVPATNDVQEAQQTILKPLSDDQLVAATQPETKADNSHIALPVAAREIKSEPQAAQQQGELYAKEPPRDNVVYIANLAVKKSSFRQVFRKASRIFDKVTTLNAPTKDDVAMLKQ